MPTRKILGAFNQGEVPRIACFNKATIPLGVDFDDLIAAMQEYVDKFIAPIWATPATLFKSTGFVKNAWAMVFLDDADQPGALAYHDLTPDGLPQSKVFVKTTLKNGNWTEIFASKTKRKAFAHEDRRGHRSEERTHRTLKRAEVKKIKAAERHVRVLREERSR